MRSLAQWKAMLLLNIPAVSDPAPAPVVLSVSPNHGPAEGNTEIIITGTYFSNATRVEFWRDGAHNYMPFTVHDHGTKITAYTPAEIAGRVYDLKVTTPTGDSTLSPAYTYDSTGTIPVVVSISPTSGTTLGSTHVVIQVDSSTGAVSAAIDGVDLTGFAIDDATHVSGNTVADSAGAKNVTVTNATGTSAPLVGGYTYVLPAPTVASISPDLDDTEGGGLHTIIGTGFSAYGAATAVTFGGTAATGFSVISDTEIIAIAPAHAAGASQSILVTTPAGTNAANTLYEYWDPGVLALTGFWERGDYLPGTWTARASQGTSGGRDLTQASTANQPSEANLEPIFDGVNDYFTSAFTLNDAFATSAGSFWFVFDASSASAPNATKTSEVALLADTGSTALIVSFTTAGVRVSLASGGFVNGASILIACPINELHIVQAKWDGAHLFVRLDGGVWQSAVCAAADLGASTMHFGANWNGGLFYTGLIRSAGFANSVVSDPLFDKTFQWAQARHGVAV